MLYRSTCCDGGHYQLSAEDNPKIPADLIDELVKRVFDGTEIDRKELLDETAKIYSAGVRKGYNKAWTDVSFDSPDWKMLTELHYNVGVFAAFKNHNNIKIWSGC